ncbi:AraC family transcriptional regulator [Paenibacillus lautus]|uniref:AraC family transcriptional regulator n=1 Tax=Paenibacillus lautus TaxID=1401 RepID=UPI003D296092
MAFEYAEMKYCIPSDMERKGGIWILRTGRSMAKPHYYVGPKISENYTLHFVLSGKITLAYGDEEVTLSEGDVFCLFPHTRYSYWETNHQSEPTLRTQWVTLNGEFAVSALNRIGLHPHKPFIRNAMKAELPGVLNQIYECVDDDTLGNEFARQKWLYQLFELLAAATVRKGSKSNWLEQSVFYMDSHYMEGITVTDVVEYAGVHRTHLYCEFIRAYGISPSHYLMKLRMERAAVLLTETDVSVTEAAFSLGYSNLHTFSRAFAKYYHTSPTSYRQRHMPVPT